MEKILNELSEQCYLNENSAEPKVNSRMAGGVYEVPMYGVCTHIRYKVSIRNEQATAAYSVCHTHTHIHTRALLTQILFASFSVSHSNDNQA